MRILGWLYVCVGGLGIVAVAVFSAMIFGQGPYAVSPETKELLLSSGYGTWLLGFALVIALLTLVTGFSLLHAARWARRVAFVLAILGILDFPIGTLLGVYTLWVLLRKPAIDPVSVPGPADNELPHS